MRRFGALLAALLLAGSLTACGGAAAQEMQTAQVFAMDTVMGPQATGGEPAEALAAAEDEIYRLDEELSRTREDSAVSQLNRAEAGTSVEVGTELYDLIARALAFSQATDGAFDITLAPVSSAWGFTEDAYRVPAQEELAGLLAHVGSEHVHLDGASAVSLDQGTQIDLGAIAKGYASDAVAAIYQEHGITHGIVDLGGNTWVCGGNLEGEPWQIGIQDPARSAGALAGILEASDAFAVTSGGYQRYFEENGQLYHHIIDPATGRPAESGLTSVTVVADGAAGNGTMCDALSTALFVMGLERATEFWRASSDFEAVFITEDGTICATEGAAALLTDCTFTELTR
mgnify:CR=1 FL=1